MKNFRLQILLERAPLTEEDKHNISIIFDALSFSRQQHILDHWDECMHKLICMRKELDDAYLKEAIDTLKQANTLLDEAIVREQEKEAYKEHKKQEIRHELENTVAYGQLQKLKKIKEISKIPA